MAASLASADNISLQEIVVNSGTNELFYDGNLDEGRALSWTRLTNKGSTFVLAASNGFDIWKATFEKIDLIAQCESSGLDSLAIFMDCLKYSFDSSTISLVRVGSKVILQCTGQKTAINFDLFEAKINDKKTELQYMLFHLTDKVKEMKASLTEANEKVEMARQKEKDISDIHGFGFEPVRKAGPSVNRKQKPQGTSLVNPNSKKSKRPKGISFE